MLSLTVSNHSHSKTDAGRVGAPGAVGSPGFRGAPGDAVSFMC